MSKKTMYFSGVPTDPDVTMLSDAYKQLPDETIPYSDIEKIIGCPRQSNRFRSVTTAWRKKIERETDHILIAIRNDGYKKATPKERVTFCGRKINSGIKFIARGAKVAASTDTRTLSPEDKKICDHFSRAASAVSMAIRVAPKEVQAPQGY